MFTWLSSVSTYLDRWMSHQTGRTACTDTCSTRLGWAPHSILSSGRRIWRARTRWSSGWTCTRNQGHWGSWKTLTTYSLFLVAELTFAAYVMRGAYRQKRPHSVLLSGTLLSGERWGVFVHEGVHNYWHCNHRRPEIASKQNFVTSNTQYHFYLSLKKCNRLWFFFQFSIK